MLEERILEMKFFIANPLWLTSFFNFESISAKDILNSVDWKIGSYPNPLFPIFLFKILPSNLPSTWKSFLPSTNDIIVRNLAVRKLSSMPSKLSNSFVASMFL